MRSALARLPAPPALTVGPEVDGRRYPAPVEGAAYFLVLEGLANAMKHAGRAPVEVSLTQRAGRLEVVVRDAGAGFTPRDDGTGLLGLSDRLAAAGGELEIDSRPGRGTVLRGSLPGAARG